MSTGYVIPVDPSELANRVQAPDRILEAIENGTLGFEEDEDDDIKTMLASDDYREVMTPLLARIPEREADLIELYFFEKKRQADIAEIFDVTQAAISYRLDRGIKRMKFLMSIPRVTEAELREALPKLFNDPIDVNILVGMWQTTCQSEVATQLNLTQGRVRHRFFKAVKVLGEAVKTNPWAEKYHKIFFSISSKNFNVLREVKLPQWSDRGGHKCI